MAGSQEFIPLTVTECIRELSKLIPGSDSQFAFIQAGSKVTWARHAGLEEEKWEEEFTVSVGAKMCVTGSLTEVYEIARDYIWRTYGR